MRITLSAICVVLVATLLMASGCCHLRTGTVTKIKPGVTTREYVVSLLGTPNRIRPLHENTAALEYCYDFTKHDSDVAVGYRQADENRMVGLDITFDKNDRVLYMDVRKYRDGFEDVIITR